MPGTLTGNKGKVGSTQVGIWQHEVSNRSIYYQQLLKDQGKIRSHSGRVGEQEEVQRIQNRCDLELAGQQPEKMKEDHLSGIFFPGS